MTRKTIFAAIIVVFIITLAFVAYLGWQALTKEKEEPPIIAEKLVIGAPPAGDKQPAIIKTNEDYKKFLKMPAVSPNGVQRAFFEKKAGVNYLKIIDIKSNKIVMTKEANFEDAEVVWHKPEEIFITERPSAEILSSIWSYNLKTGEIKPITQNEAGLIMRWSADAAWALKFNVQNQAPILTLIDNQGRLSFTLPFITLPDKCAFSDNKIFCAVPAEIPANMIWPDDYWKKKFYPRDKFLMARLNPLKITVLFDQNEPELDAVDLLVKDEALYFTNRYDNKVYSLPLK